MSVFSNGPSNKGRLQTLTVVGGNIYNDMTLIYSQAMVQLQVDTFSLPFLSIAFYERPKLDRPIGA